MRREVWGFHIRSDSADHSSILEDSSFSRYAYGVAQGAALNPAEPWRMAAAVGRDVGQLVLGTMGWKPSAAEPEQQDESTFEHYKCAHLGARLKVSHLFLVMP